MRLKNEWADTGLKTSFPAYGAAILLGPCSGRKRKGFCADKTFAKKVANKVAKKITDLSEEEKETIICSVSGEWFDKKPTQKSVAEKWAHRISENRRYKKIKEKREAEIREQERAAFEKAKSKEMAYIKWLVEQSKLPDSVHTPEPSSTTEARYRRGQ